MRIVLAVSLAALAAAPLLAKPAAGGAPDPERERWRGQGISMCVADLNSVEGVTPDDSEAICGCAFDRFMDGRTTDALPPFGPDRLQAAMGSELLSCAATQRPALAAAVARRLAAPPPSLAGAPPLALEEGGKPTQSSDAPAPAGFDFQAWLDGLLPRWLSNSDLPLWAWILLGPFVLLFLRGLLRRREGRDLIGPPPGMGPGARPGPPPPRG